MAAAQNGRQAQAHAVQLLMRRGADPSAKNLENEQPIQLVPEGSVGDQVSVGYEPGKYAFDLLQLFILTIISCLWFFFFSGEKNPERPWPAGSRLRAVVRQISPDLRPSETLSVRQSDLCTVSFAGTRQMSVVSMKQS